MGSLMLYSDSLVIGAFLPIGMITYFSIAGGLSEYARSIVSGVSQTLTPRISALQAGGQQSDLRVAVLTSARLSSLVVYPIVVTFVLRGGAFIGLWMGPQYADLSGRILVVLSATLATLSGYQIVTAAMLGMNRQAGLIPVFVAEAFSNLVLSVIWVRIYGVIGTAFATMIPRVIIGTLVGPWYVKKHLGLSVRTFWMRVYVQPALAMLPFAAATYAVERFWPARNLAVFFLQVLVILPVALVASWYVCLTREERTAISRVLRRPVTQTAPTVEP
jgi:O-antigen/teichoic acid export membrane protein